MLGKVISIVAVAGLCSTATAGPDYMYSSSSPSKRKAPPAYGPVIDNPFSDNFDSYAPGPLPLNPPNGWQLWDAVSPNGIVDSQFAASAPNSLLSVNGTDVVRVVNVTSGKWRLKLKTYHPTSSVGEGFVIGLNTFAAPYVSGGSWSLQVHFNGISGVVQSDNAAAPIGPGPTLVPLIRDQWVEFIAEIDLDPNLNNGRGRMTISYGGNQFTDTVWVGNVSGVAGSPPFPNNLRIQCALDAFATVDGFRWDDVEFTQVGAVCYPDCNGDGNLNLADFGCFQTKFALGDPYADCNGDGNLNLADFGCFQTKFALGCP